MADNLPESDLGGWFGEQEAPIPAGHAFNPPPGFEVKHDLLEEATGNVVDLRDFANRNRGSITTAHQGHQGTQCVIGFPGQFHRIVTGRN